MNISSAQKQVNVLAGRQDGKELSGLPTSLRIQIFSSRHVEGKMNQSEMRIVSMKEGDNKGNQQINQFQDCKQKVKDDSDVLREQGKNSLNFPFVINGQFRIKNMGGKACFSKKIDKWNKALNNYSVDKPNSVQKGAERDFSKGTLLCRLAKDPHISSKGNLMDTGKSSFKQFGNLENAKIAIVANSNQDNSAIQDQIKVQFQGQTEKRLNLPNANTNKQKQLFNLSKKSFTGNGQKDRDGVIDANKQSLKQTVKNIQTQANEQSSQSEEEQFDPKATPGPGEYNLGLVEKHSFRSQKQNIKHIFYSNCNRFATPNSQSNQLSSLTVSESPSDTNIIRKGFFVSKLPKFHSLAKESTPPPGYYNTRQTLEHDLIRGILKSSNSASFINSSSRGQKEALAQASPGPGTYNLNTDCLPTQQDESYMFKSSISRISGKIAAPRLILPECIVRTANQTSIIHTKIDQIIEDETRPPFMSSSDRFAPSKIAYEVSSKAPSLQYVDKSLQRPVESKAAFNSSSKRQLQFGRGSGVGVGLYDPFIHRGDEGRSFNFCSS